MSKQKAGGTRDGKALVIVESPAKARTINKYLGRNFVVKASMGHVRDLPKSNFGIDLTDNFKPTYEIVRGRTKVVGDLQKLAAKAREVFLATDRDREGEAIAWHLVEALRLPPEKVRRVIFNEITKTAITAAFAHPHKIDLDRVNAQQARRILDRIVGYELSPLLWRKIAKGLSAGRVQSVTVRLIVDRERDIRAFVPEESWKVFAYVTADEAAADGLRPAWKEFYSTQRTQKETQRWLSEHNAFRVELAEVAGESFKVSNADAAAKVVGALGYNVDERIQRRIWDEYQHLDLSQAELVGEFDPARAPQFVVSELTTKRTTNRPSAPFTTATLQQQASTALRFSNSRTMRLAQALYEGIDLSGEGPIGLITYMRTDSTNVAGEAVSAVRDFIKQRYGDRYLPEKPNTYDKRQSRAQEAHEAIRPTDPRHTPESVRRALSADQYKLYDLIWKRFVACQMPAAQWDLTSVSLTCETVLGPARFAGSGRKLVFDGYMKVAGVTSEDQILPPLEQGSAVGTLDTEPRQQFTSPPPRYTEASLVKALESEGIGRPSTYATIIETVQQRGYVEQAERKFHPTSLGEVVTDKLVRHFPKILDVKFTSHMEDELDKVEEAHLDWVHVLHEFYDPFKDLLARAGEEMEATRSQPSEYKCPLCEAEMVYRWGKMGRFLSCSKYPECRGTFNVNRDGEPLIPETEQNCELCGRPMVLRQSRTGFFLGCGGYPDCRNTIACGEDGKPLKIVVEQDLKQPCEACGEGTLRVKWKGRQAFLGCDCYPQCKNTTPIPADVQVKKKPAPPPEEAGVSCEKCHRPMVLRAGTRGKFIACSGFPKCRNTKPIEKLEELRAAPEAQDRHAAAVAQTPGPAGPASAKTLSGPRAGAAAKRGKAVKAGGNVESFGDPPPGFAWTRTGRPVVETMPADGTLVCPQCGNTMELKRGRFGPFFSCGNFPRCKFVSNLRGEAKRVAEELVPAAARPKPVPTDITCNECGAPMLVRQGPRGRFLGCSGYPKCKSTQPLPAGFDLPVASEKG